MSATTMSGADAVKGVSASGSKQSLKSSTSGKTLVTARKQAASPPVEGQNRKSQPPAQKAWTGTNPITQRASAVIPNGTEKSTSRPTSQSLPKAAPEMNGDKHAHDRALHLLASFTGNDATITLRNGEQFTGIFSGGSFDSASKHQYILKMVKRVRPPTQQQVNGASTELLSESEYIGEGEDHVMVFDKDDTVDLSVPDVVPMTAQPMQNGSIGSSFRTDTEISGRDPSMPRERELQRWDGGADTAVDLSLDDSGATGWDQFAVNEAMYGVSTTYDENIYTTQIDRQNPRYRQREAEAARIAREIEGSAPANAHVAEERLQDAQRGDGGMDEEEKYSGVRREAATLPKRAQGAYVPPSQRPLTNAPTVPGAPFDPAIISLAKPTAPTERSLDQPKAADTGPSEQLKTPPTETVAKDVKSAGPSTTQQTLAKKTENTTEDHVRGVADSFKQFANNEKLRLRLAQEQKRTAQRAEKNVKLNDLKKFAANFKLNSRIPDDLVPILAKDHDKQKEIQRKADEAYIQEEKRAKDREIEKASIGAASPAPSAASSIAGTAASLAATQSGKTEASHVPFSQVPRGARMSTNTRQPQPIPGPQMQSPRQNAGAASGRTYANIPGFPPHPQPLPGNIRIPTGPAHPVAPMDAGPLSPGTAKLNASAKSFEFKPMAHSFTPNGTTPSPQRLVPETAEFFAKDKSPDADKAKEQKDDNDSFSAVKQVIDESTDEQKTPFTTAGGVPQPYRTPPTWSSAEGQKFVNFQEFIPKAPTPSQTHSQMHTPNPNTGQMPHAHQLPPHMQGPLVGTPSQRPPYMPPTHLPPNMPPHHQGQFAPGMHGFGGNGSVHSSPRFGGASVAFNGQIPSGMGMPQFAGQQFNGQQMGQMGMQGYGMSPNLPYRQVAVPGMPPGATGGMMMMGPGAQGQHGQMSMQQGYPRNPQQFNPQMMPGGVPMANQPSAGGYSMPGPLPGQQQSYSPMPPHATPNLHHSHPHNHHLQQSPYAGSPRPAHMMQHTASHQGFNPGGPMGPYAPNPGMGQNYPHHPYALQHRQMSAGGYPAMTPRQQQAVPNMPMQPSPGMAGAGAAGSHGDEGK